MTRDRTDVWEGVGRDLAATEVDRRRAAVENELYDIADRLRTGEELRPEDIDQARRALNDLRRLVEDQLAPVAGVEPWAQHPPSMPFGVVREHYSIDTATDDED